MTHRTATRAQPDAAATFAVGQLVRVSNPLSRYDQMTGTIVRFGEMTIDDGHLSARLGKVALLRLTAWGTEHIVLIADLVDERCRR